MLVAIGVSLVPHGNSMRRHVVNQARGDASHLLGMYVHQHVSRHGAVRVGHFNARMGGIKRIVNTQGKYELRVAKKLTWLTMSPMLEATTSNTFFPYGNVDRHTAKKHRELALSLSLVPHEWNAFSRSHQHLTLR